jgi:hypothetical protein
LLRRHAGPHLLHGDGQSRRTQTLDQDCSISGTLLLPSEYWLSKSPISEKKLILLRLSHRKVVVDFGAKDLKWLNANQICPRGQMARASSGLAPPT